MYPNRNSNSNSLQTSNKYGINNSNVSRENEVSKVVLTESTEGYHLELEIVGYIKDDFNFYLTINDELVLTTEKSKPIDVQEVRDNSIIKHSYCYASALLRKTFRIPKDIVKNEIFIDYKNNILSIDLLKLKAI